MQQDKIINNIREISYAPVKIYMFHEKMLESVIFNELQFKKHLDLHIECTGSLFKELTEKRAFYYSISLPSLKDCQSSGISPQISVCDAILADHTTLSTERWLEFFVRLIENETHQVRKVETDYRSIYVTCLNWSL